jgi:Putative zinc-finger
MTCAEARELLSAAVDDALDAGERDRLDAHLATCADCRREQERVRDTVALLHAVEPARAPVGFVDRVLGAARPVPWPRRLLRALFLPWPVKLPLEAAASVLVAVGVVYLYQATPEVERAARLEPPAPSTVEAPRTVAPDSRETSRATPSEAPGGGAPAAPGAKKEDTSPPSAGARTYDREPPAKLRDAPRESDQRRDRQPPRTAAEPAPSADAAAKSKSEAPPARQEGAPESRQRSSRMAPAAPEAEKPPAGGLQARRQEPAAFAPADVSGGLVVNDRDAAVRALTELVTQLGGAEDRRFTAPDVVVLELSIPRDAYPELARQLRQLGRWQPAREATDLPARVRVLVRISG